MEDTKGVQTLLGDPKRAILALAIPIAIASLLQSVNNIIDAVWVSGLGTASLAATGVVFPYFFVMLGIGNGIGVGASQAIARRIGARDDSVHKVASQAFMLAVVIGLTLSVIFFIFLDPLMAVTGAGDYKAECVAYGAPLMSCGLIVVFCSMLSGMLRAEGAAKRAMVTQCIGAGLNVIFDPIFIYGLNLGIGGAAWATVLSMGLSILLAFYWYFIKKDTFVHIPLRGFRFNKQMDIDILKVGIPASLEMILISLTAMVTNLIVLIVDAENGIAIFTTGWRIIDLLTLPAMSIGFAVVPVCAAAYGAKELGKMRGAYVFSMKVSFILSLALAVITVLIAPLLVYIFTYSDNVAHLSGDMALFIRICCIFLPFMGLGFPSTSMFQALGKGANSLVSSIVMNLLRLPLCYVFAIAFGTLAALTFGMVISEIAGSLLVTIWVVLVLRRLLRNSVNPIV